MQWCLNHESLFDNFMLLVIVLNAVVLCVERAETITVNGVEQGNSYSNTRNPGKATNPNNLTLKHPTALTPLLLTPCMLDKIYVTLTLTLNPNSNPNSNSNPNPNRIPLTLTLYP